MRYCPILILIDYIRFQIKKPLSDRGFSIFQKPDYFNLVSL